MRLLESLDAGSGVYFEGTLIDSLQTPFQLIEVFAKQCWILNSRPKTIHKSALRDVRTDDSRWSLSVAPG